MKPALQTNLVPQIITLLGAEFDCKFAPYFRMAEAIIELAKIKGECLPQDLLTCGFSKAEIDDRWHMSNAMANVELNRMNINY
ncbi:MAG: hypothetical protein WC521_05710 [Bdellovibrionales bacterium]|jgi:hypothetical protein